MHLPGTTDHPLTTSAPLITDARDLGTVVGIWGHPDDEALLSGGLMAAARDARHRVVCVTATLGEHGTNEPHNWPPARLGAVRGHEIRAAVAALDVTEHHLLGIMDGTCAAAPHDAVVALGPDGYTGHSGHQTVSARVTAAHAIAAPKARLLYATTTRALVNSWQRARDAFDVFLTERLPLRTPAAVITAVGEDRVRDLWSTETFTSADSAQVTIQDYGTWRVAA